MKESLESFGTAEQQEATKMALPSLFLLIKKKKKKRRGRKRETTPPPRGFNAVAMATLYLSQNY